MAHDVPRNVYEAWQRLMMFRRDEPDDTGQESDDTVVFDDGADLIEQADARKTAVPKLRQAWDLSFDLAKRRPLLTIVIAVLFGPIAVIAAIVSVRRNKSS